MEKTYKEFLDFMNYYHSCAKRGLENCNNTTIHFSYNGESLVMEAMQNNELRAVDSVKCSNITAVALINKICEEFVKDHKMSIASVGKDLRGVQQLHIHNTYIEIVTDLQTTADMTTAHVLVDQTFNKISSKNNTTKDEISNLRKNNNFQVVAQDFFEHYKLCLKRCEEKDGIFDICPYYSEGRYTVKIMKNGQLISIDSIKCTEKEAELLNSFVTNSFINDYSIFLSSIAKNYSLKQPELTNRLCIQNIKFVLNVLFKDSEEDKMIKLHEKALSNLQVPEVPKRKAFVTNSIN